jgi:hypothetical protein
VGKRCRRALRGVALLLAAAFPARAEEPPATGSDFGGAGLIEMRNARFRPDGTIEAGTSWRRQRHAWFLSFQALPFLETTFRLTDRLDATRGRGIANDRAFDLKLRLWQENAWRPALAVGLQDVIGTGLYGGEYIVASKRIWDVDLSLGLGWGRLGTGADIGNPMGEVWSGFRGERSRQVGAGGTPSFGSLFRGERAAVFGGVEWSLPTLPSPLGDIEGLRAKLEWSGDALRDERGGYPARTSGLLGKAASRINLGLQWQPNPYVDAGVHFVHGTDLLLRLSLRMDPARPPELPRAAPPVMGDRPAEERPEDLPAALRAAGFRPVQVAIAGEEARITVEGGRFATLAQTAGRVARAVQPHLPPEVERLRLEWRRQGVTMARLVILRAAMEAAARGWGSAEEVLASATLLPAEAEAPLDASLGWAVEPRLSVLLGDPKTGFRWQVGVGAGARLGLGGGFALSGSAARTLAGNLDEGLPSDSALPHVRSDFARYAREGRTSIPTLYAERIWTPAPDVFARVTAGLLEPMFAGVSAEALWRPHGKPFALGLDVNWVAQRAYDGGFSTLGYSVATGHVSLYADLPVWNLYGVLRGGRYLAGDWGGTIEIGRRFDSGIEVGGFATFTNVPFSRFGEGSFDKGIYLRFPLQLLGPETSARATAVVRPVQRDGGQRLLVDNPLWEVGRDGRADALQRGFMGFLR